MKRFFVSVSVLFLFLFPNVYAYSSAFEYMIETMNIAKTNVHGLELNEEVYEKYKLLVYGNPSKIKSNEQRWKEVSNGNWTKNGNAWNGRGVRGEYWVLGEDYSGIIIHNEIFPDDYNSGTSPLNWNYRVIKDADESWVDTTKYQYDIQREYMLTQKLSRFGITYDITALDIGLNKARVENYATWGSAGSIYTEKTANDNSIWVATFRVPPIAGEAKLNSIIELPNGEEYTISKDEELIEIPVSFGAFVNSYSEYAKPEHVKIIESAFKVNGVVIDTCSGGNVFKISKDSILTIDKFAYGGQKKVYIELECDSFLSTVFVSDTLLYSSVKKIITINIEDEEEYIIEPSKEGTPPAILECEIRRITSDKKGRDIPTYPYYSKRTKSYFVCAGQVIQVDIKVSPNVNSVSFNLSGKESIRKLDELTKKFEWDDPKSRGTKTRYSTLSELKSAYVFPKEMKLTKYREDYKVFTTVYVIPYETTPTLYTWNSLRKISKNAFSIDESKLFTRVDNPYSIVIRATSDNGTRTCSYVLDIADRWDELYNRDISDYVINRKY